MSQSLYSQPSKYRFQPIGTPQTVVLPTSSSSSAIYSGRQQPPTTQYSSPTAPMQLQQQFAAAAGRVGYDAYDGTFSRDRGNVLTDGGDTARAGALDEAAMDLLRLSTEPAVAAYATARPADTHRMPKSASTSSVPKHVPIKSANGAFNQINKWGIERESSPDTLSTHAIAAARQNVGVQQPISVLTNNGARRPPLHHHFSPPPGLQNVLTAEAMRAMNEFPSPHYERHVEREHVMEEERKVPAPPIVRTTVEGRLKMEKTVGSHLLSIDHSVAKAYTIRDTTTNYTIRTIMGKREIIMEETVLTSPVPGSPDSGAAQVRRGGTYRLSVYEDGQEIGRHEADINVPENMNKPDYLAKLSERLLADLATLDGETITAATRVEIEKVEDVTDLVKTYLIGPAAPEEAVPTAAAPLDRDPLQGLCGPDAASGHPPAPPGSAVPGYHPPPRPSKTLSEDAESLDSLMTKRKAPEDAKATADCDLHRTEDSSVNEVFIALPLIQALTFILRVEHHFHKAKDQKAAYDLHRQGQQFKDRTMIKSTKKFDSEEEEELEPAKPVLPPRITIDEVADMPVEEEEEIWEPIRHVAEQKKRRVSQVSDEEAAGGMYDLEQVGQLHQGASRMRRMKQYSSEESSSSGDQQPQAAVYDLQTAGQHLQGSSRLRRMQKYDSETSIDYEERAKGGGITHVTLIKKEAIGHFQVTIECPNNYSAMPAIKTKEVADQKYENLEYMKTLEKDYGFGQDLTVQVACKVPRLCQLALRVQEYNESNVTSVVHVQRSEHDRGGKGEAAREVQTPRRELVAKKLMEFSQMDEYCSVLMESRGVRGERAQADWGHPVTGELFASDLGRQMVDQRKAGAPPLPSTAPKTTGVESIAPPIAPPPLTTLHHQFSVLPHLPAAVGQQLAHTSSLPPVPLPPKSTLLLPFLSFPLTLLPTFGSASAVWMEEHPSSSSASISASLTSVRCSASPGISIDYVNTGEIAHERVLLARTVSTQELKSSSEDEEEKSSQRQIVSLPVQRRKSFGDKGTMTLRLLQK
uniref:Uncharacterized protein n=1 Tax=Ditylenchus dipsaci TaxID=166011 RepID=A0A915D177_9BILA